MRPNARTYWSPFKKNTMKGLMLGLLVLSLLLVCATMAAAVDADKVQALKDQQSDQVGKISTLTSQVDGVKAGLDFVPAEPDFNAETATQVGESEYTMADGTVVKIKIYKDPITGVELVVTEYPDGSTVSEYKDTDGKYIKAVTEKDGVVTETKYVDPKTGNTKTITEKDGETTTEYSNVDGSTIVKETTKTDGSTVTEYVTKDGSTGQATTLTTEKDTSGNTVSSKVLEVNADGTKASTEITYENGDQAAVTSMDYSDSDNTLTTTKTGDTQISTTPGAAVTPEGATKIITVCEDVAVEIITCSVTGETEIDYIRVCHEEEVPV